MNNRNRCISLAALEMSDLTEVKPPSTGSGKMTLRGRFRPLRTDLKERMPPPSATAGDKITIVGFGQVVTGTITAVTADFQSMSVCIDVPPVLLPVGVLNGNDLVYLSWIRDLTYDCTSAKGVRGIVTI